MENKYKTCIHCWNWNFYAGSETTPKQDWEMICIKEYFHLKGTELNENDLRKELFRAQDCNDFDEVHKKS